MLTAFSVQRTAPSPLPLPITSEDGVDLTVIRWMLSLTPERLEFLEQRIADVRAIGALNAGK